jgi:hypothetical protein
LDIGQFRERYISIVKPLRRSVTCTANVDAKSAKTGLRESSFSQLSLILYLSFSP